MMNNLKIYLNSRENLKILSKIASIMAILLMAFMLLVGPTLFILGSTIQSTGYYLQSLIETGTWMEVYEGEYISKHLLQYGWPVVAEEAWAIDGVREEVIVKVIQVIKYLDVENLIHLVILSEVMITY